MAHPLLVLVAGLVVAILVIALSSAPAPEEPPGGTPNPDPAAALGDEALEGYARARAPRAFSFPRDHGAHPRYRTEWWYFTGNLWSAAPRRRFGYELSLFRVALSPEPDRRNSAWATNQIYMGHFALTDAHGRQFRYFERFARAGAGLAGAQAEPFRVWLEDWAVRAASDGAWQLQARSGAVALTLRLRPTKPVVLQGERGLSRKSAEPGNASYYYSITRLASVGELHLDGTTFALQGDSWMDREWSTSALGQQQSGWDWFALQLDDGRELMYYQLRRHDGSVDPHSQGVVVDARGETHRLARDEVSVQAVETWTSPRGGTYPNRWRLRVPKHDLDLEITPVVRDQELNVSVRYWEGAVDVRGTRRGHGYVELTGYADSPRSPIAR